MVRAKNIVTSVKVEIDAPSALVWQVLTDLPKYHEWNPFTVRVESALQLNDVVKLYIPDPSKPGSEIEVVEHLIAFEPCRLLSWEQRPTENSSDAARRDQYVEAIDDTRCSYQTTDVFLGLTADKVMETFGSWVKEGLDGVAVSLKARAESLYADAIH